MNATDYFRVIPPRTDFRQEQGKALASYRIINQKSGNSAGVGEKEDT